MDDEADEKKEKMSSSSAKQTRLGENRRGACQKKELEVRAS